jgi:nitroimidazol reductase NimA-like FMN-containing flavoprotein (pyridoxamine 5'-phosphate oxidase superfamily)
MRRPEREVRGRETIGWIIEQAQVCRLGLCRDGVPYVVPVNFGYDGQNLYFHTAPAGMKIDFIESNPRVCFELEHDVQTLPHERWACRWSAAFYSVVGWGTVSEVTGTEAKEQALRHIMRHYSDRDWAFDREAVDRVRAWRLRIEQVTGKHSGRPDAGRPSHP